jgi:mRNA-degrading endonuclease RelE of RelBE toxin-antitoxin system
MKTMGLAAMLVCAAALAFGGQDPRERYERRNTESGQRAISPRKVPSEQLERWRRLPPEEQERIRERYRRWKELPPSERERILERSRKLRELPERDRNYIRERRDIYREAWPEEKRVIRKFVQRWKELPPAGRRILKRRIAEWRNMPVSERDEQMSEWPFYKRLSPEEQKVIRRFLFSEPVQRLGPRPGGPPVDERPPPRDGAAPPPLVPHE